MEGENQKDAMGGGSSYGGRKGKAIKREIRGEMYASRFLTSK